MAKYGLVYKICYFDIGGNGAGIEDIVWYYFLVVEILVGVALSKLENDYSSYSYSFEQHMEILKVTWLLEIKKSQIAAEAHDLDNRQLSKKMTFFCIAAIPLVPSTSTVRPRYNHPSL